MEWFFIIGGVTAAAAAAAGLRTFIESIAMSRRGPKRVGMGINRKVIANPRGQLQIEARRAEAIEIGRAELAAGEPELWDKAFHQSMEHAGGRRELEEPGDIIVERSLTAEVHFQEPDRYSIEECECRQCVEHRNHPRNVIELYKGRVDPERRWG